MYKNQFAGRSHPAVFSLRGAPPTATRLREWRGKAAGFSAAERLRRRDGRSITPPPLRLAAQGMVTACYNNKQRDNGNSDFFAGHTPLRHSRKRVAFSQRRGGATALRRGGDVRRVERGIKKTGRRAAPFGYWVSGCGETVRFRPSCRRMGSIILR